MSLRVQRLISLCLLPAAALAGNESDFPKWDAGVGAGYLNFEHYPASNQYTTLALPFPTFSYRGRILRADDRDGAKLFLVKHPRWVLQFGGIGFPPLSSSTNDARQGMPDLPLVVALGPQLQHNVSDHWAVKVGAYQALAASWLSARSSGALWEVDGTYRRSFDFHGQPLLFGIDEISFSLSWNLMGASHEMQTLYYEVTRDQATSTRPAYQASAGLLQSQVSYFQTLKRGPLAFYAGMRLSDYRLSANRASPLYRTDQSFSILLGLTLTLFQSKSPGVPYDAASGVIEELRH